MIFNKIILTLVAITTLSIAQVVIQNINDRDDFFKSRITHLQRIIRYNQQVTENQEDFDISYYSLNLTPNTFTSTLIGTVEIMGTVVSASLEHIELNFWDGMNITSLHLAGLPGVQLAYSRGNNILSITLDRVYAQGEIFNISVSYNGKPQDSEELGWGFGFDSFAGEPMVWSFSQPWGARVWWPCKDVPSDKADSVDVRITVPGNLIAVSNGALISTSTVGTNTIYWWHEKYPIATYLVSLAIYPYEVNYDDYVYNNGNDTMKIHFYTFPGNYNQYYEINMKVKEMLEYFSSIYGQYPFIDEKYGLADFTEGGAIEHQTIPSFNFWEEWGYAHELSHMWWGDMVTYDSWHDTWLSEGLAVYSEALWHEHVNGSGTANDYQMDKNLYFGPGTIYVEDFENFVDLIDSPLYPGLIYQKASWVFHMLRHIVGEENFFDILLAHRNNPDHYYGTATTESFQEVCEQVSGMDLDRFFHQWIYEEYFPIYSYSWNWTQNGSNFNINLEIQQEQDNYLFWMPIDISITTVDGEMTYVVWDSLQSQSFQFSVSSEPTNIELDKDHWILKLIHEPFVNPTFDEGILLVNGVSFDVYNEEIRYSYNNRAFWGELPISFWDCFDSPGGGYPSILPNPLGHGKIPNKTLGRFSTLIWIGNNYNGDLSIWKQTQIQDYLHEGGNLILLTRKGQDFLDTDLQKYLGITWKEDNSSIIQNCIASYPGLLSMDITGKQTGNAVFDTALTKSSSTILFEGIASSGTACGLGVLNNPDDGGKFVFISGRPYRYDFVQLSSNIEFIMKNFIERLNDTDTDNSIPELYKLEQNYPNPFNPYTIISYQIPKKCLVSLKIYDVLGKEITTLVNDVQAPNFYEVRYYGTELASGVYFYQLKAGAYSETKKMILLQ
jgi:aminopeptidase N